jgi:hypothetical protein
VPTVDGSSDDCVTTEDGSSYDGFTSDEGLCTDEGSSIDEDDNRRYREELAVVQTLQLHVMRRQQKRRRLMHAIAS